MAFIVEQFVGDRGIQLGVENIVRPFQFGTNWTKIRVGVRWAMNGYATFPQNTMPFVGVCTGSAGPLSPVCVDAVYLNPFVRNSVVTYAGTAPNNYLYSAGSTALSYSQTVAGSTSVFGSINVSNSAMSANPTLLRTGFFFDIQKASGALVTPSVTYTNNTQVLNDLSRGNYLAALEAEATTYATWLTYVASSSSNLTLRTAKDWDSMVVGWSRAVPTLCVYDMTVVRFL